MMLTKKIVVQLKVSKDLDAIQVVESLFRNNVKPDLVFLDMESSEFPDRSTSLPDGLMEFVCRNPKVKFIWDGKNPLEDDEAYEIIRASEKKRLPCDFVQKNSFSRNHEFIDMTMVSVFYDAGINPLRKEATKKAVACWMKQKHLPQEMMFVELGFNGEFTFSKEDFPKQINYIRIDGNDSHKYLFQKEHLWNIAAKRAKHEKLMFVDSDIAPFADVDWFKQTSEVLEKCLFAQGFNSITYLDRNERKTDRSKRSFATVKSIDKHVSCSAPGGVFCVEKSTLRGIGYFNYIPFGGGDLLFWSELSQLEVIPWFYRLCVRESVKQVMGQIAKESGKKTVGVVPVDVFHFFHGDFKDRTYNHRDFMLATQFPWNERLVIDDNNGLCQWIDTSNWFYDVAKNFSSLGSDGENVRRIMSSHLDYAKFYNGVQERVSRWKHESRSVIVKQLGELVEKCKWELPTNHMSCGLGDPKVTVITPLYNAEQFVDGFFAKLSRQTIFKDIEVICIDDASTDGTYMKLLEHSSKYSNVILLRNYTNMGAGHSRNRGLDIASGEYISFLDSDDWYFSDDSLERFYQDAIRNRAEICGSAISNVMQNGQLNTFFTKEKDFKFNDSFVKFDDYQNIYYFTRYLYRRNFLNDHGIRFRNFKRFQDPYFLYEVMVTAKQFFAVPYSTYCYTTNDHWSTLTSAQHYDRVVAISKLFSILPEKHEKIKKFLLISVVSTFKGDSRLLGMVLSDRALFMKYYALFFNPEVERVAMSMRKDLVKLYMDLKSRFSSHSKVSIVIPVYNGEKYIDRCMKSILEQDYSNIEVICVDDCSTDNSYSMLKEYEMEYPNVKVFQTEVNSGCCSNPRNLGMKHATGQYVQFVDIDDMFVDGHVISTLVGICQKGELDYLRFTFKVLNEYQNQSTADRMARYYQLKNDVESYTGKPMTGVELYFRLKKNNSYQESAALGMFDMDFLRGEGIEFIENIIHEDVLFTPMVLSRCRRCMQLDKQMYLRSVHGNSIITTTNNAKKRNSFNVILSYIDKNLAQQDAIVNDLRNYIKNVLKNLK